MAKPLKFPAAVLQRINEMRSNSAVGLRNSLSALRRNFYQSPTSPALRDTQIDKDRARGFYYNTNYEVQQGAFLARPIVDGIADYIGIPTINVQDENTNDIINNLWINGHWKHPLWEAYRNCLREADTWVRIRRPFPVPYADPDDELQGIQIEVIDSDRVTPYYDPATNDLIRIEILTRVYIEDQPFNPYEIYATGLHAHGREHEIVEIITKSQYLYYDATNNVLMENYTVDNEWGFVACVQFFNDFDSALHGGLSELENVVPFFYALHDLVAQTRTAHGYLANPKVKFKLDDVATFLRNNFPASFVDGKFSGKVSWRDTDVFFMESAEDVGFVEATLNTGDSVALMEFIIDCICMAAEVPESVLFRTKSAGSTGSDEYDRFKHKISRKRDSFERYIQTLVQMGTKIAFDKPKRPSLSWAPIEMQDLIDESTAMNNIVTAAEVANRAGVISKVTYQAKIKPFFPGMKNSQQEMAEIASDTAAETQQQVDLQTKLNNASPNGNNANGGPNSASRRGRLPLDVAPPPASG